jgi:hypothetical protein
MFCTHCGKWNYLDSNFCRYCGRDLKTGSFHISHFFVENKDLFLIFGLFGGLALYLSTLGTAQGSAEEYIFEIGIFKINFLKLAIASSLILVIILGALIVIKSIEMPMGKRGVFQYFVEKGSFHRIIFLVPFVLLVIMIGGFVYHSFKDELSPIFVIYSALLGYGGMIILTVRAMMRFGKKVSVMLILTFPLALICGILHQYLLPSIPSDNIFFNSAFVFNLYFGQGAQILFIVSLAWAGYLGVKRFYNYLKTKIRGNENVK